jgi:hypothetical protein
MFTSLFTIVPWWARLGGLALAFAGAGLYGYVQGAAHAQAQAQAAAAAQQAAIARVAVRQSTASTQVVTQYLTKTQTVTKQADAILREVPIYVHDNVDRNCTRSLGDVGLLVNSGASAGTLPPTPADLDAASTTPTQLADWAVTTYQICTQNAAQLTALQQWIIDQRQAVGN